MKKRLFRILILMCLVCGLMCACGAKEKITADQAISIMLEDLGENAKNAGEPHVHEGTYENEVCYNIFVTVNGESWAYVISADGEIIAKGLGGHSH